MEAPPTPPLEVADFLLEFSVILFDPPAAFGRGDDVLEGRMARQGDQPIANRIRDPHSSSSVCSPSAPSRPRIAAKRPLNSGPLPSRHVRHAERGTQRPHRQRRVLAPPQTACPAAGVVARTAAA
jgi:hypothetical protein